MSESGICRSGGGPTIQQVQQEPTAGPDPTVRRGFANRPVDKAINERVDAAVTHAVENTPPVYFHREAQDSGEQPAPATKPLAR